MADIRLQAKAEVTESTVLDTDVVYLDSATGGSVRKMPISELIKKILGGAITAGVALPSSALVLGSDKKVEGIAGIEMASNYEPTADLDLVTKTYLEDTVLNEDSPVLIHRDSLEYLDFTTTVALTLKAFAAGVVILGIYIRVKIAFTDTGSDLMKIGKTGDDDYFEADIDISTTGMKTVDDASFPYVLASNESITATYTGANDDADAGSIEIYIHYADFV